MQSASALGPFALIGGQLTSSDRSVGPDGGSFPDDRRLVIYPQGQPADVASREACAELVTHAGGDLCRTIEARSESIDAFIAYAARLKVLDVERAIVVLTRTVPLVLAVLNTRRRIEHAVPMLEQAAWLVFVDPLADREFFRTAALLGELDDEIDRAPIWSGPGGMRFLLVSPLVRHPRRMSLRVRVLEEDPTASATLRVADTGTREVPSLAARSKMSKLVG
jgi:hypothetical protein